MKKVFTFLVVFAFAASFGAFSQTVTIGNESGNSPVDVPVAFSGFANLESFDLYIEFPTPIIFQGVVNADPSLTVINPVGTTMLGPNKYRINWFTLNSISPVPAEPFYLRFASPVAGGPFSLTFSLSDVSEVNAGTAGTVTLTSGSVYFDAPSVPLSNWAVFIGLGLIIAFVVVRFRRLV